MESWIIGALLLISLVIGFIWSAVHRRKQDQILASVWSELAVQTGLHYSPGGWSYLGKSNAPSVSGKYRGRYFCLEKVREYTGAGEDVGIVDFIDISVHVDLPPHIKIHICPKGFVDKILELIFGGKGISNWDELDREYYFKGQPEELVYGAAGILRRYKTILLTPQKRSIMTISTMPGWASPSFEIKGAELVCRQRRIITSFYEQILLFNLMLELAEFVEKTGKRTMLTY